MFVSSSINFKSNRNAWNSNKNLFTNETKKNCRNNDFVSSLSWSSTKKEKEKRRRKKPIQCVKYWNTYAIYRKYTQVLLLAALHSNIRINKTQINWMSVFSMFNFWLIYFWSLLNNLSMKFIILGIHHPGQSIHAHKQQHNIHAAHIRLIEFQ